MNIETLSTEWLAAKAEETATNKKRVAIEQQIITLLGALEHGSQTHDQGDFKITITGKLNYKADFPVLDEALKNISPNLHPVKIERKLDDRGLRYLQSNEPEIFAQIAHAITITPAKTSVTIKHKDS